MIFSLYTKEQFWQLVTNKLVYDNQLTNVLFYNYWPRYLKPPQKFSFLLIFEGFSFIKFLKFELF